MYDFDSDQDVEMNRAEGSNWREVWNITEKVWQNQADTLNHLTQFRIDKYTSELLIYNEFRKF